MDLITRKRKLSEVGGNVTSPRHQTFTKTAKLEENGGRIPSKIQALNSTEIITSESGNATEDEKCEKLEKIPESNENVSKRIEGSLLRRHEVKLEKNKFEFARESDEKNTLWFSTDYIEDIISHEVHKESLYRLSESFCKNYEVNPTGREILIDWLISVQVHLKAENSTLHLAVALLDTMLDSIHIPLNELQAAAIAAFWVAYKFIHGSISKKTLLGLCEGSVTKEMIAENEILVLQTSSLIQAGGSLTVFVNYILYQIFGFKFPTEIYYCGFYFIEIMLLQFIFVDCSAYEKAVTAVFASLSVFGCSERLDLIDLSKFITKKKLEHVHRLLMQSLRIMYSDKDALKKSSVFRKYKSSRYYKISVHRNVKCLATQ